MNCEQTRIENCRRCLLNVTIVYAIIYELVKGIVISSFIVLSDISIGRHTRTFTRKCTALQLRC